MSKRFTCTDKWKKKWIRNLESKHKLLWLFLLDMCDHGGILDFDIELFSYMLNVEFDIESVKNDFGDKILFFKNDDKIFIPSFIDFQYGELNEANKVHKSVINLLKKQGLFKGLDSTLYKAKDKDKEKDKDKDKEKEELFKKFWTMYDYKKSKPTTIKAFNKLSKEDINNILSYLPSYIQNTQDKQFRKHPTTFLNQRAWEDEIVMKVNNKPRQHDTILKSIGLTENLFTPAYDTIKKHNLQPNQIQSSLKPLMKREGYIK